MKKWAWISFLTFFALAIVIVVSVKNALKNIEFEISSGGVDATVNSWSDVQSFLGGKGAVTLNFIVGVTNKNWFNIPIRDLETRVYYQGHLIGNSSPSALKNIDVNSGSYKRWTEPVDLHAKTEIAKQFLQQIISGEDPVIDYETELKVWGIRYTYSDRMKIVETALSELA